MNYPIIVPAKNEAESINDTLESLPQIGIEPIVVANGCTDDTAKIARLFGAQVIELEEPSKVAAIKAGLKFRYKQAIGSGWTVLDADTKLLFPDKYVRAVTKRMSKIACGVLVSPMFYVDEKDRIDFSTSIWHELSRLKYERSGQSFVHGANMIMKSTPVQIDRIIEEVPDNEWPHEDTHIVDMHRNDVLGEEITSYDLRLASATSRRGHPTLADRILKGADYCTAVRDQWHDLRKPPVSI